MSKQEEAQQQDAPPGYGDATNPTGYAQPTGYAPPGAQPYPPQGQASYNQQPGYAPLPVGGYAPQQGYYGQPAVVVTNVNPALQGNVPEDHCTYSILVTIFCCFWIGIFAIIKSQAVRDAIARGDLAGARLSSSEASEALRLNKIGLGVGIAVNVIYIVLVVVYCVFVASTQSYNIYG
ncbi:proline-rich transmembrane protein 1-like [Watersipora subatra]|uniref:proline-rich transmembrane protein 1-like n=1 Tax=Watersipora subatra TaxID=2589382 RepID=UPI00355C8B42